jgi:hypothetical protein
VNELRLEGIEAALAEAVGGGGPTRGLEATRCPPTGPRGNA